MFDTEQHFYELIGNRLRELREKSGVDQVTLAKRVDITQSYLSRIERGQKCSAFLISKILFNMGFSYNDLMPLKKKTPLLA